MPSEVDRKRTAPPRLKSRRSAASRTMYLPETQALTRAEYYAARSGT